MWLKPIIILLSLLWCTNTLAANANTSGQPGSQAPRFSLPDSEAKIQDSSQWKGKIVVINFWATWCAPCLKEIPMFNQVQRDFAADGVIFVGIAVDTAANVKPFLSKVKINYPILIGDMEALKLVADFGNRTGTLPYTVFVDRQGRITSIANGLLSRARTMEQLEKLL